MSLMGDCEFDGDCCCRGEFRKLISVFVKSRVIAAVEEKFVLNAIRSWIIVNYWEVVTSRAIAAAEGIYTICSWKRELVGRL